MKHIILAVGLASAIMLSGCGTTTETKITQADQVLITGVNDSMAQWAIYVNAGKAKQSQIDRVKTAYTIYYNAQIALNAVCDKLAVKDPSASAADVVAANSAVSNAETSIIALVASFINSKL